MTIILRLTQWSNSAPFQETDIDLTAEGHYITIGHPPPGVSRTAGQCWLKFEVVEFDHAQVWRQGDRVCLTVICCLLSFYLWLKG
jgi:hypothetical protein